MLHLTDGMSDTLHEERNKGLKSQRELNDVVMKMHCNMKEAA